MNQFEFIKQAMCDAIETKPNDNSELKQIIGTAVSMYVKGDTADRIAAICYLSANLEQISPEHSSVNSVARWLAKAEIYGRSFQSTITEKEMIAIQTAFIIGKMPPAITGL